MKIYISGLITNGGTATQIEENRAKFFNWESRLINDGHQPVNPLMLPHQPTWAAYMKQDIKALLDCDAILLLDNWTRSRGAALEQQIAEELDLFQFSEQGYDALSRG